MNHNHRRARPLGLTSASWLALAMACAGTAQAEAAPAAPLAAPAPDASATAAPPPQETEVQAVVVTATRGRAADVAPVKSSLSATEPKAIITRKFIEESAPRVGDYTTSTILAPSMATTPNPNGSGSTDGAKITLRGFQDGEFNVTYDGIAWGDTNGPSHHSNSFFPSSTIGGIVVDRGPGHAYDLGQANFGGSVNLFSLPFEDKPGFRQTFTEGSFQTSQSVTTLASGPISQLHGANVVMNFMEYTTNGYLTNSPSAGQNQFIKINVPITSKISLTALYTHNYDDYNQGDSNSAATVAQTELFGKRYALSNDPTKQTYYGYNKTKKKTDFEYVRLNAEVAYGFSFEDTIYSYAYNNRTLSGADDTSEAGSVAVILNPPVAYPKPGSAYAAQKPATLGLPGYLKRNQYRVTGDVLKGVQNFDFGTLTFGAMYEFTQTERSRFDIDLLTGKSDYREKAATFAPPPGSNCNGLAQQANGACEEPLNVAYNEYSGWNQYQPFASFEWRPLQGLTITPGVKYVNFELHVHAPAIAVKGSIQPSYQKNTYEKTLPFLTANYLIKPNWSVYAEYAQGFLVPNISAFYVNNPLLKPLVPQESTNYQVGTVFNAGRFAFDGDIYYINFKNKIQSFVDANNETYQTNSGGAHYKGVELQGTYVFDYGFSAFANGALNDAIAVGDPNATLGNGKQIAKAPNWTGALGGRWEHHGLIVGDDNLVLTLNDKFIGHQYTNGASNTAGPSALIKSFSTANFTGTYRWGHYSLEGQILNLFDSQNITSLKGSQLAPGTNYPAASTADLAAIKPTVNGNQFTYQVGRSYQITVKAAF